jgi:hypothetical protein
MAWVSISLVMTRSEMRDLEVGRFHPCHMPIWRECKESGWEMPHVGHVDAVPGVGCVAQGALGGLSSCQACRSHQDSRKRREILGTDARCNLRVSNMY